MVYQNFAYQEDGMEPISDEIVAQTWREVATYSQEMARDRMKEVGQEQPYLLTFALEFMEGLKREE